MQKISSYCIVVGALLLASSPVMAERKGLTWGLVGHRNVIGVDFVSCHGLPAAPTRDGACNAYQGDTPCTTALPLLCVRKDHSVRPNYALGPGVAPLYRGWVGGHLATTLPVVGDELADPILDANDPRTGDNRCRAAFGEGWRMAEFHDGRYVDHMGKDTAYGDEGYWHSNSPWPRHHQQTQAGGWAFIGYGHLRDDTRYWIRIDDQSANCWR